MKKRLIIGIILLGAVAAWLLWPLTSNSLDIKWDESSWTAKKAWLATEARLDSTPPNVLLIMVDDLSLADISMYTVNAPVRTPQMERLCSQGVRFDNAYVTHAICSPSRAAVLTGRYPQRYGFEHQMHDRYLKNRLEYYGFKYFVDSEPWIPQPPADAPTAESIEMQGLPPTEITLAEVLKRAGYATGLMGKWHLGVSEENQPCNLGFDEFYGFNASHSLYAPEGTPGIVDQKIPGDWTDPYIWSGQRDGPHAINIDCNPVPEDEYLTFTIANQSRDFISRHRSEPFFLMASFNAPHTPLQAPKEYVDAFASEQDPVKRVHYAMIAALDDAIGALLDHIDSLGISENTMVFMISDNGGAEYNLTTENGPYRGGKVTDFEGGIKVPFAMQWKGHFPKDTVVKTAVSSMDIFSTVVSKIGTGLPSDRTFDGVDLEDILRGKNVDRPLFWRKGYNSSVRSGTLKVSWNDAFGDTLMYDLAEDPFEQDNIYSVHSAKAQDLIQLHDKWSKALAEPLWPSMIHYIYEEDGKTYYFDN